MHQEKKDETAFGELDHQSARSAFHLRRLVEKGVDLRSSKAGDVMHANPRTVRADSLAVEAAALMEQHRITSVLVVDEAGVLCGALNSNDLMRAKVI